MSRKATTAFTPILEATDRLSKEIKEKPCTDANHSERLERMERDIFSIKTMLAVVNDKLDQVLNEHEIQFDVLEEDMDRPLERNIKRPIARRNGKTYLPEISKQHILDLVIRDRPDYDEATVIRRQHNLHLAVAATIKALKETPETEKGHSCIHWNDIPKIQHNPAVSTLEEVASSIHGIPLDRCEGSWAARLLMSRAWAGRNIFRKKTDEETSGEDSTSSQLVEEIDEESALSTQANVGGNKRRPHRNPEAARRVRGKKRTTAGTQ